ncbi:MAG: hypothetical protein IJ635_11425 [Bacteroidaceae bacterium]|nr:hypothetical protein [Bacteroidaceae bacterium]
MKRLFPHMVLPWSGVFVIPLPIGSFYVPSKPQKWSESDHRSGVTQTAEVV